MDNQLFRLASERAQAAGGKLSSKALSAFLSCALVFALTPLPAFASEAQSTQATQGAQSVQEAQKTQEAPEDQDAMVNCQGYSLDSSGEIQIDNVSESFTSADSQDLDAQLQDSASTYEKNTTSIAFNVQFRQSEARQMIDMVNNFRTEGGVWYWNSDNQSKTYPSLQRLQYDKDLENIAMQRAAELILGFSHTRPDGTSCFTATSNGISSYGENIAMGQRSSSEVMESWKETDYDYNGQGHRRNMLGGNYNCAGYACVEYNGWKLWVQEFGYRSTPDTNVGAANDSSSPVTFPLLNSDISSVTVNGRSSDNVRLSAKGNSKKIPTTTGSVVYKGTTLSGTFKPNWHCADDSQISIQNGYVSALVDSNNSYVFSYIGGRQFWLSTRAPIQVNRIFGSDAIATNYETVKADIKANGAPEGLIVCTNGHYIDSLSAAALSGLLDYPIVIVNGADKYLNSTAKSTIDYAANAARAAGKEKLDIVIMGGNAAVSDGIKEQLDAYDSDGKSERVFGKNGYETNIAAYDYGATRGSWNNQEVLIATGNSYYDALGAGSYAAARKAFILLTNQNSEDTNAAVYERAANSKYATICGGEAAVTRDTADALTNISKCTITRVSGSNAYLTNYCFVDYAVCQGFKIENAGVSTGTGYWDALGSSHILGKSENVMFLVSPNSSNNSGAYLHLRDSDETLTKLRVFGGNAAVTDDTCEDLKNG